MKKYTAEEIENMLKNSTEEITTENENIIDEYGNIHNVNALIEETEKN